MVKTAKKKAARLEDIELHPDAWKRFEGFVKTKVRTTPTPVKKTASRRKSATGKAQKKA